MIAGGFDGISEEGSYEFANMEATSNAETEFAMTEMSPTSRAGFMESQVCTAPTQLSTLASSSYSYVPYGSGVHIVMSAKIALELGAPIRGILASTLTSTPHSHSIPVNFTNKLQLLWRPNTQKEIQYR